MYAIRSYYDHPDHQSFPLEPDRDQPSGPDGLQLDEPLDGGGDLHTGQIDMLQTRLFRQGIQQHLLGQSYNFV